ncbi:unnamed protein product, partial [Discosporangium mesarthrocarpum]
GWRGAGAVLLEVATGVTQSLGMGDVGGLEELVSMLLTHWHLCVMDGRAKMAREARDKSLQEATVARQARENRSQPQGEGVGNGGGSHGPLDVKPLGNSGDTGG